MSHLPRCKSLGVLVETRPIGVAAGLTDISRNGERLVVNALEDGKPGFKVFSLPELELVHEALNLPAGAGSFAFSPSGKYLALGLINGTVQIWDLKQKKIAASWVPHQSARLMYTPVAYSPDGKRLATGGRNAVRIWDLTPAKSSGRPSRSRETVNP